MNPFYPYVNPNLRKDLAARLRSQVGELDAQVAQAPPEQRETVRANLFPQRAELLREATAQSYAAMYGLRNHMEDWSANYPSSILLRSFTSEKAYQDFGGTNPALGGREPMVAPARYARHQAVMDRFREDGTEEGTPIPQSARRGFLPHQNRPLPHQAGRGAHPALPATLGTTNVSHPYESAAFLPAIGAALGSSAMGAATSGSSDELTDLLKETNRLLGQIAAKVGSAGGSGPSSGLGAGQQFLNDPAQGIRKSSGL
jgi:hypothetical protein